LVIGSHLFQSNKAIKNQKPIVAPKDRPKATSVKTEVKTVKLLLKDAIIVKAIENIAKSKPSRLRKYNCHKKEFLKAII
jgi:hypothetical protein